MSVDSRSLSRVLGLALLGLSLFLANITAEAAPKRLALVIGNQDYLKDKLRNPVNDARAFGSKLGELGFEVVSAYDLKRDEIGLTLENFLKRVAPGDNVVFFYAGHGVQFDGKNYLLAVDANLRSRYDVPLSSIDVGRFLNRLEDSRAAVKIIFLDACRNNPFEKAFRGGGSRGLARMGTAPSGTLISFATRPGGVAADGDGAHGLYTEQLLRHVSTPGIPVEQMLKRVAVSARQASAGEQEPWIEGSLVGDFVFNQSVATTAGGGSSQSLVAPARSPDAVAWQFVESENSARAYNGFLKEFPDSQYAGLARLKLSLLKPTVVASAKRESDSIRAGRPASFLPWEEDIPPGSATAIDGIWHNELLQKRFRIDRGRIITVDTWKYLFTKTVLPDTVVTRDLLQHGAGHYIGFDLPNQVNADLRLQADGSIWLKLATFIPVKAVLKPVKLVNQRRFNQEIAAVGAASKR
ncbi:MAG: caspase family protein [Burkholderiaceae bacterium]